MIDREVIEKHLEDLAVKVSHLKDLRGVSLEELQTDWQKLYAAERALQTAIQDVIDIGAHILAALGDNGWEAYRDIPRRLAHHGVIAQEEVENLEAMIGMRNVLVHQYVEVNPQKVYEIIHTRLADFERFAQAVAKFLQQVED